MKKRVINQEDYPMVLDWSGYKNIRSRLLCKCQGCGCEVYKTIDNLDQQQSCYCKSCGAKIKGAKTFIERYGVTNTSFLVEIKEKTKQTNLEKYGVEYTFQAKEVKEKIKTTNLEKYGVENAHSKEIVEKIRENNLEKYGVQHHMQNTEIKEKIKQTNLEKYGIINSFQSEIFKDKSKQTNLEKYDVEYFSQINREPWQIEITSTKENFIQYLETFEEKPTVNDVAILLGFKSKSALYLIINNFNLLNYFDSFSSIGEKELTQFIESLGFNSIKKKFNGKYEIDCFIPELNIGFEFNGNYWHSDLQKTKNYHYDKVTFFQKLGIRCIMIWEHEWVNNNEYIKSYIKAQLGLCEHRIYARKCEVREITYNDCKELLNYHQQKQTTASNYIGLYYNNELVLAMLLQKPQTKLGIFKNKEMLYTWDVKREICKEGYSIVGGKSKVFKYFVNKYKPQQVVSYVDRSKFTGKSYEIMGFKLEKVCGARYDWVINGNFKKRTPSIYKKMMELYNDRKALRIYDSGRYKFVWKL